MSWLVDIVKESLILRIIFGCYICLCFAIGHAWLFIKILNWIPLEKENKNE